MNKQIICSSTKVIDVKESAIPKPPSDGLVLKVHYVGICHSDAHVYSEEVHSVVLPRILGQEISGTVYALGQNCENLKLGDEVVVYACSGCQDCLNCRGLDYSNYSSDHKGKNLHNYGIWKDGGFQNYMLVENCWNIVKLPAQIPLHLACLVPCSGVTAYNAVEQCADSVTTAIKVKGQASILILGTGGVGIWAIQFAKIMYGKKVKIIAADISESKLNQAKNVGADYCCLIPEEADAKYLAGQVSKCINGGVDAAMDFVNNTATFEKVFWCLGNSSTYVMVGVSMQTLPPMNISLFIVKNIRIQGVYCGSKEKMNKVFRLLADGEIKGPEVKFITLEEVEGVLKEMSKGSLNTGHTIVDMDASFV